MKRIVKVNKVSAGGVSLEVVFEGVGWLYGYEVKTHYATMSGDADHVRFTSQYFSKVPEAQAWLEELTEDLKAIEFVQKQKAKEFKKAICGETEIK